MQILLASSPHADTFGYSMPPPGLLRLGGELQKAGIAVALDDLAFRQAAGQIQAGDALCASATRWLLERGQPEVLGLSVMGATLPAALGIAALYKQARPETPIWIGGPGTTGTDQALLERFACIDAVVRGEGEFVLAEWFRQPPQERSWRGLAGVTWRDANGTVCREPDRAPRQDLSAVADYAWELLPPLPEYKALTGELEGLTPLDSGRGCVYDCSFCTIGRYWQRRSRPLPVDRLVAEILSLPAMPGAKQAYLCHDIFGADRAHALELCEKLIAAGSHVPFEVRARIDHLDSELLERMSRAGCYRVLLGIESAAHSVRAAHQKNMRADVDPMTVIDACEAVGIVPILSMILGLPGEGPTELAQSLDLCAQASLRKGVHVSLHLVNPQPGCGLGETHGPDSAPVEGIAPDMALGAGTSATELALIRAHPDLFSSFHLLPAAGFPGGLADLHALANIAHGLPELLRRYPRSWALLQRLRGENSLELWRALQASGLSFAGWVAQANDPRLSTCLRWEQASIRVTAKGLPPGSDSAPGSPEAQAEGLPKPLGETMISRVPLGALAHALRENLDLPALLDPAAPELCFAIVPGGGHFGSVRTLEISPDTQRLLQWLQKPGRSHGGHAPGLAKALGQLQAAGLLGSAS